MHPNASTPAPGVRFGRWTILHEDGQRRWSNTSLRYWMCSCECGTVKSVYAGSLKRGTSTSCGCLTREVNKRLHTTHGRARTPEYESWLHMRKRCLKPGSERYRYYGERGITICAEWDDFATFYRDMGPRPSLKYSLDRIDVNGNYEPSNCRWADPATQRNNRRDSR